MSEIAEEIQKALDERRNYGPFHHWLRWQQGEIERLKSELAEKDKVLLDIKYQIEQSNHPAGISVLSSINYILSQYKKGDNTDDNRG